MTTILVFNILYYTLLYYTMIYYTMIYYSILYYYILYYTILYYSILKYTILYYTILHYTTLYYTILYYTIPHYISSVCRFDFFNSWILFLVNLIHVTSLSLSLHLSFLPSSLVHLPNCETIIAVLFCTYIFSQKSLKRTQDGRCTDVWRKIFLFFGPTCPVLYGVFTMWSLWFLFWQRRLVAFAHIASAQRHQIYTHTLYVCTMDIQNTSHTNSNKSTQTDLQTETRIYTFMYTEMHTFSYIQRKEEIHRPNTHKYTF